MNNNYSIGDKIREYRHARNLSQEELAFRADISCVYLRQIEKGVRNPTISVVLNLCNALSIQPSDLFKELYPSPSDIDQQILTFLSDKTEDEKKVILELIKTAFKLRYYQR